MLVDWLTLRHPLDEQLGKALHSRILANMGRMVNVSADGVILWEKAIPDWEAIRSDSQGLFWSITADADSVRYLTIGASPASLLNAGVNVFGSLDLQHGSEVLIKTACKALGSVLPNWRAWQCRRIDVTANYDMGSAAQVKQALRLLMATDAARRKASSDSKGGDSVYWNVKSALRAGKAYHKGAHLRYMRKKGKIEIDEPFLDMSDRLLRLELKLGATWCRRLQKDWHDLTEDDLIEQHSDFFGSLIGAGDVEVSDMGILLKELERVAPTKGRALAAHRTWALIKALGYTQAQESMPRSTFMLHKKYLRAAGISSADLCAGKVLEFRKKTLVLDKPVLSWDELRRAA